MLRSVFSNWVGLVVTGATSFLVTPILIHSLGDFYYGLWILIVSTVGYYGVLDLGVRPALFRTVAWYKGGSDRTAMHELLLSALVFAVAAGFCVLLLTVLLVPLFPGFFKLAGPARRVFPWVMILLGVEVALAFPVRMLGAYLSSLGRFDLNNLAGILGTILRAAFIVAALRLGYGIRAVAGITLGETVFTLLLSWWMVRRQDSEVALDWGLARWSRLRELFGYGSFVFIGTIGDSLRFSTDSLVIARMLGAALITPFSVAARLVMYLFRIVGETAAPLMGRMSELDGRSRDKDLQEYFLRSTRISALLALFTCSVLILDGRVLLRLWVGERFVSSYPLLLILAIAFMAAYAQQSNWIVVRARARHRPLALLNVAEGVANLLLSIYWARRYGLIGIALGTVVPMVVISLLVLPWYALRVVGLRVQDYLRRGLAQPAAVGVLFAAACWLIPGSRAEGTIVHLLWAGAWQTVLFGVLSWSVGLRGFERAALYDQGKQFAATLRLVRAS